MRALAAAAALAVVLGSGLAAGGPGPSRFTPYMDDIRSEVADRTATLGTPADKPGKKLKTAFTKTLAELAKSTTTLAADATSASKALKLLEKALPGDGTMEGLYGDALPSYFGDVDEKLTDLRDQVSLKSDTKSRAKALAALGAADDALEAASVVPEASGAMKGLVKALAKGLTVQKYLDKNENDHGACLGRSLEGDENLNANKGGQPWIAMTVETSVTNPGPSEGVGLTYWKCDAVNASFFSISFSSPPTIGPHDVTVGPSAISMTFGSGPIGSAPVVVNLTGTMDVNEVDVANGNFTGLFNVSDGTTNVTGGFRVVGAE